MPIPIAFILPDLGGGGAQAVMLQIAGGLDPARFAAHLLVAGGSQAFAHQVPRHVRIENGAASRLRDGLPWLLRRIRALRPHAAVSVMGYLNLALLGAARMLGSTRLVVREANVLAATSAALPRWLPTATLYRRLYPRAAAIVSPTAPIADEIARVAPAARGRIHVIPNPVDTLALRGRAASPVREPGQGPRFVSAGRLTPQKGYDRLVDRMLLLPADARLTIYGEGPDRPALETQISRLGLTGRVRLPGFTADLPAAIAGADAFLLPSRWEGLPNVVLESLALGTPVIASEEAAVAEIAAQAPAGAVTIRPVDDSFALAMLAVTETGKPPEAPRASLLPPVYLRDNVVAQWQELLSRIV